MWPCLLLDSFSLVSLSPGAQGHLPAFDLFELQCHCSSPIDRLNSHNVVLEANLCHVLGFLDCLQPENGVLFITKATQ